MAINNGPTIGFAAGHLLDPVEEDQPAAQLIALVTTPAHQRTGAGSALCREFEDWALSQVNAALSVPVGQWS